MSQTCATCRYWTQENDPGYREWGVGECTRAENLAWYVRVPKESYKREFLPIDPDIGIYYFSDDEANVATKSTFGCNEWRGAE